MKIILWIHEDDLQLFNTYFKYANSTLSMDLVQTIALSRNQTNNHWMQVIIPFEDYTAFLDHKIIKII
jgi:hypothetical protein